MDKAKKWLDMEHAVVIPSSLEIIQLNWQTKHVNRAGQEWYIPCQEILGARDRQLVRKHYQEKSTSIDHLVDLVPLLRPVQVYLFYVYGLILSRTTGDNLATIYGLYRLRLV